MIHLGDPGTYRLHHDFETYSDISVTKVGSDRMSRDPSTEALMCAFAFDDDNVQQWIPAEGAPMPKDLREALRDPMCIKFAWNKPFEYHIWKNVYGIDIPHEQWRDPMILAHTLSLPGALAKAGNVIGLPDDKKKDSRGKALIRKFCGPRKPTKNDARTRVRPHDEWDSWEEFLEYNVQDVIAERSIWRRLRKFDMPRHEWELWFLDQKINEAGVPINMRMVDNAIKVYDSVMIDHIAEMKQLTGLDNPNSVPQILPWLRKEGYPYSDCQKAHIKRALEYADSPPKAWPMATREKYQANKRLKKVLGLRLNAAKQAPKKYNTLKVHADEENEVIRNVFQFAGAGRTWRWAGRTWQAQNLTKPTKDLEKMLPAACHALANLDKDGLELVYGNVFDVLSSCVRPCAQAVEGYVFADVDLSAIENRVLGWMTGCEPILDVFRMGRDPYIAFATKLFGRSYESLLEEYEGGNHTARTLAKPGVLGCFGEDTKVLTHSGWKRIVDVVRSDLLFDGEEWVEHDGVVFQGRKDVLCRFGVYVTLDHKILTDEGWKEVCQLDEKPNLWQKARDLANGKLLSFCARREVPGLFIYADVLAGKNRKSHEVTSFLGNQLNAFRALYGNVGRVLRKRLGPVFTTCCRIVFTRLGPGVKTPVILHTDGMEVGVLKCGFAPQKSSPGMSLSVWVLGKIKRLTEWTTTGITKKGTFVGLHEANKTEIRETWDILNAGPNSRYMVLTDDGPLVVHNCGYMLGPGEIKEDKKSGEIRATGLLGYAWNMGIRQFTKVESALSVETFRRSYREVKSFWYEIDNAARKCIKTKRAVDVGPVTFDIKGPFMRMRLPSGRYLHYFHPAIKDRKTPWGEVRPTVVYMGLNDRKQWVELTTHPGKWTENADQAISRDLLAHGMVLADKENLDVRIHVHDQLIAMVKEGNAESDLQLLKECMMDQPSWAKELPMGAGGFLSPIFTKD